MKKLDQIQQILSEQKPYLLDRFGVVEIGVFGSYIRNEQTCESDIDLLVRARTTATYKPDWIGGAAGIFKQNTRNSGRYRNKEELKKTNW